MNREVYHTLKSGRTSGINLTAKQLTTTSMEMRHGITILASSGNVSAVFVGPSGVTAGAADATCGFCLSPNTAITVQMDNPSTIWAVVPSGFTNHELFWIGN